MDVKIEMEEQAALHTYSQTSVDGPSPPEVSTPHMSGIVTQASERHPTVIQVKPKEFSGEGSWRQYHSQFERIAKINNWTEEWKLEYLWVSLTGESLAFVEELPIEQQSTYQGLCRALDQRFGSERLSTVHKATLLGRRRKAGETMTELGQDVRRLVNHAYPDFPQRAKEEIAIERFLDALDSSDIRLAIHQQNPKTLDHAIEVGLQIEAWKHADNQKHASTKTQVRVAEEDVQVRLINDLRKQVEELKMTKFEKKQVKCYLCGKLGHIARDCRSQRRWVRENDSASNSVKGQRKVTCFRCGQEGHFAKGCAASIPENQ